MCLFSLVFVGDCVADFAVDFCVFLKSRGALQEIDWKTRTKLHALRKNIVTTNAQQSRLFRNPPTTADPHTSSRVFDTNGAAS